MLEQIPEATLRLSAFASVLVAMALYELAFPRRKLVIGRGRRWFTNLGIVVLDSVLVRILFPVVAVGAALWADSEGYGLFNLVAVPGWVAGVLGFLLLDFAIWGQHLASHKIPVLWRVHRVHHSDRDIDVTTALRFHPIEIVLSMVFKMAIVVVFGIPPLAVLIFEVVLNGMAMFNHANVRMPVWLDAILRKFVVTPDMHRVHHSIIHLETDSNYGFNLSVWDRLFATYIAQPSEGHDGMTIGLAEHQSTEPTRFAWSLLFPFRPVRAPKRDQ
ncbi:sterol desaturase family protein [Tepidamorphus sp. 3E244]|uniref:sterol desaturase family protein n=1 Tax=Tepidamorphus sp. 3E244 TaxID=3385498 RepID=UPI0038FCC002